MKKIAIVGVESSGKTVFLAAMGHKYESPDENGVFLKPLNRRTYAYYTRTMAELRGGGWPIATQPGDLMELDWELLAKDGGLGGSKSLARLSFLDFAGEVYRMAFGDGEPDGDKAKEKVKEAVARLQSYVREADVLVILVDLRKIINGDERDARTIEMNWLTQAMLRFAYEEAGGRSVALVFTQVDRYSETFRQCGGVRGALAKYLRVVDTNYGDRLSLFEVSAVDRMVPSPDNPAEFFPAPDFGSRGLEELMKWLVGCVRSGRNVPPTDSPKAASADGTPKGASSAEGTQAESVLRWWLAWLACLFLSFGLGFCLVLGAHLIEPGDSSPSNSLSSIALPPSVDETAMSAAEGKRKEAEEAEARRRAEEEAVKAEARRKESEAKRRADAIAAAKPGYVWDEERGQYFWQSGLRHPDNKRLVSDTTTGWWKSVEDGYVWTGGSNTAWRAGLRHSKVSHATSAEEEECWTADPGYKWVEKGSILKGVVWEKGQINYRNSDLVSGEAEGSWVSTRPGYEWAYGTNLIWKSGLRHTKIAHVKSAKREGYWAADPGYEWVQKGDMSKGVAWNPGEIDGDRKAASVEGQWLRKCKACDGNGKKDCRECDGDHKVTCPYCHGNKKFETEGVMICDACYGNKKVWSVPCGSARDTENFTVYLEPLNPQWWGRHVYINRYLNRYELCTACGGSFATLINCQKCDGQGRLCLKTSSACMNCRGEGSVPCPECTDGKRTCPTCKGTGWRGSVPAYR